MNRYQLVHRLALVLLTVLALTSIVTSFHQVPKASFEMKWAPVFGIVFWGFLIWKLWKHPRKWGLGLGILLFLMIGFQSYLWSLALADPKFAAAGFDTSTTRFVLLYELPIFVTGILCLLLRFLPADALFERSAPREQSTIP